MGSHLEPYCARDVVKYLERLGGIMRPQRGGGSCIYAMPNGVDVRCPNPSKQPITSDLAKTIAVKVGKTFQEFRAGIGHPIVAGGKGRAAAKHLAPGCTKRDVVNRLRALHHELTEIEQGVAVGIRDAAFYARVNEALVGVDRAIHAASSVAVATGAPVPAGRGN